MRIAIASILQESNTFSPVYTRYDDFSPVFGREAFDRHQGKLTEMGGFIEVLKKQGVEIIPVCAAWAITANRLLKPDFQKLVDCFVQFLSAAPVDGLLLAMHGAQTAAGEDDVEGHVLSIARKVLGPDKPIVLTLDLHANITRKMVALSTAIVGYKTYPHVDMFETGEKAAGIIVRTLKGELQPKMAFAKLPLIIAAENSQTHRGQMHKLRQMGDELEHTGKVESISLFPTQPWMDIDEMGTSVVAVTNGNAKAARKQANAMAKRLWNARKIFDPKLTSVEDAIDEALKTEGGPIVLAESSDSTGSGSPGDSTGVLKHLVKAPLAEPAAIFLVDPAAVSIAFESGVGSTVTMRIGGAFDKKNSKPVKVTGYVKMLSDGRWTARARGYNTGIVTSMGRSVVLEVGNVYVLIAERSAMTVDPELFRSHGIDPAWCKIVVVKSPNGFRAAYEPIAKKCFVVDTPGVSTANLKNLKWKRIARPIYPLDLDTPDPVLQ
ncbi:MAG: M81 family metallopeptidase [Bryobacterales bacterium]|nr:M81 family metallopeptidase [Bryobacterales bacterium]